MKKYILIFLCFFSYLHSQNISLNPGWYLKGTQSNYTTMENFNKTCIQHVWKYNSSSSSWMVYSPDSSRVTYWTTNNSSISELKNLNTNDGFWLDINASCSLDLIDTNATQNIQLVKGWQLNGTSLDHDSMSIVHNSAVDIAWTYINGVWNFYSPHESIQNIVNTTYNLYNFESMKTISKDSGIWIKANEASIISSNFISVIDGNFTTIYKNSTEDNASNIWDLAVKIPIQDISNFKVAIRMTKENGTFGEIVFDGLSINNSTLKAPTYIFIYGKRINEPGVETLFYDGYLKEIKDTSISLSNGVLKINLGLIIENQDYVSSSSFTNPNTYKIELFIDNLQAINSAPLQTIDFANGRYTITSNSNNAIQGYLKIQ